MNSQLWSQPRTSLDNIMDWTGLKSDSASPMNSRGSDNENTL